MMNKKNVRMIVKQSTKKISKLLAPSILSANFANLEKDIRLAEQGGADMLHLDIMDGNFVPNISFGPSIVKTIKKISKLPLDTHLMIENPDNYLEEFQKAGTTYLTVHIEACRHLHRTISTIRKLGMKPGVSLNPATSIHTLAEIFPHVDLVLIMSVNPGFGGQTFIPTMFEKIKNVVSLRDFLELNPLIEVDGGVDMTNASKIIECGADILVAGNAIFGNKNVKKATQEMKRVISK